jgi:hypothetical protein
LFNFGKKILSFWRKNYPFFSFTKLRGKKKKKKPQGIQNSGPIIEGRANELFSLFLRVQNKQGLSVKSVTFFGLFVGMCMYIRPEKFRV